MMRQVLGDDVVHVLLADHHEVVQALLGVPSNGNLGGWCRDPLAATGLRRHHRHARAGRLIGRAWIGGMPDERDETEGADFRDQPTQHAIVIGIGPIGRQVASRLEIMGVDVCLVDQSPINLHAFAQQGFHTVAGDARDPQVLHRARAAHCGLVVVSVPDDEVASQTVRALRGLNPSAAVVVRCRYQGNIGRTQRAGANAVISEAAEASGALLRWCERFVRSAPESSGQDFIDSAE